jgi:pimeloyl-ACP methyl ester carboxylesterase
MKTVVWIHGLNSSHRSFGYLFQSLPNHKVVRINYDSHQPLQDSIKQVVEQLPKRGTFSLVGHSLGGLIATIIASSVDEVDSLTTISSPLGGSRAATFFRWVPNQPKVIPDLVPNSPFIQLVQTTILAIPTLSIISIGGHLNTSPEPNDSVVTVSSQKSLSFAKKVEINANHFEVLMHEKTVEHINKHLFGEAK